MAVWLRRRGHFLKDKRGAQACRPFWCRGRHPGRGHTGFAKRLFRRGEVAIFRKAHTDPHRGDHFCLVEKWPFRCGAVALIKKTSVAPKRGVHFGITFDIPVVDMRALQNYRFARVASSKMVKSNW